MLLALHELPVFVHGHQPDARTMADIDTAVGAIFQLVVCIFAGVSRKSLLQPGVHVLGHACQQANQLDCEAVFDPACQS